MKTFIGVAAALLLVAAACDTPAPQRVVGTAGPEPSRSVVQTAAPPAPLIIIDGVRQDSAAAAITPASGRATALRVINDGAPSALGNIPASDIAKIEILKGNAATAVYGAAGANGVILITTKTGAAKADSSR